MSPIKNILAIALVAGAAGLGTTACTVEGEMAPPVTAYGYEPQYYDGYVVYYDDYGRPYYYVNGAAVWVPQTAPVYNGLVVHYRTYRPSYHRWYGHYGYRYRSYRHYR